MEARVGVKIGRWTLCEKKVDKKKSFWICKCDCGVVHKVYQHNLVRGRSLGCRKCSSGTRKRPYEALYNLLVSRSKKRQHEVELSYEDFVKYTNITECHYCGKEVSWCPANHAANKNAAYNLDRMDNTLGYSKENCVVCCGRCNMMKGNHFTYEEFVRIGAALGKQLGVLSYKKIHPDAVAPTVANEGEDLAYDLFALEPAELFRGTPVRIRTGIAAQFTSPLGKYGMLIRDRSSLASKGLCISGGVIDSSYTGEILVLMNIVTSPGEAFKINKGDKIAQMIPIKVRTHAPIVECLELPNQGRGDKGFGSSGR